MQGKDILMGIRKKYQWGKANHVAIGHPWLFISQGEVSAE